MAAIFAVEDLLDFSNEVEEHEEEDGDEATNGAAASSRFCLLDDGLSSTAAEESSSASGRNADGLDDAGLCTVPYEELAELEWLSGHLEEDEPVLSSEEIHKLRLISGSGAAKPSSSSSSSSSSSTLTSASSCTNGTTKFSSGASSTHSNSNVHRVCTLLRPCSNTAPAAAALLLEGGVVCGAPETAPHPPLRGARSKRSRADPGSWASRLALLLTSTAATTESAASSPELDILHTTSAGFGSCPSSLPYNCTDTVVQLAEAAAADPPRKKTKPHHTTKAQLQPALLPPTELVANARGQPDSDGRRCLHCATDTTPQWRTGPMGPKTLCNACGVRYKSGRLVPEYRPAASPTFVVTKHSNSHRKVMELRRQKEQNRMMTMVSLQNRDGAATVASPPLLLQNDGSRRSHVHLFQLEARTAMYEAPGANAAAVDDFLIHNHVGPDFWPLI